MRRLVVPLVVIALAQGVAACGSDGGDDGSVSPDASEQLEQQRADVREAAVALLRGTEQALEGRVVTGSGSWRGCESTFNDQHRSFQYLAQGRVDATSSPPYLDSLRPVLEDAGFAIGDVGERPGGRTLSARKGEMAAAFSELPGQGDYVLLSVAGPCVVVPEGERDAWERRQDPSPTLL